MRKDRKKASFSRGAVRQETLNVGGIGFRVIRSKRRSVCIRVGDDGLPEILSPLRADKSVLSRIVVPHIPKLDVMIKQKAERINARADFKLEYGDCVRFLGGKRVICESVSGQISYDDEAFYIPAFLKPEDVRTAVTEIYRLAAKEYLPKRVAVLAAAIGCSVNGVKVNSARSHWASCTKNKTLNFSKYCMMASPSAVDYIIVHELCHLHEFNHSKRFWSLVESFCPNYRTYKEELSTLSREMEYENWK